MTIKPFALLACLCTCAVQCRAAAAADLASQPQPQTQPQTQTVDLPFMSFDIHGISDTTLKNDYITPRGLLVTNQGETVQSVDALTFVLLDRPTGVITNVSVLAGTFLDINPNYQPPNKTAYNEIDYFGGLAVTFARRWTVTGEYVQFDSPQNAFYVERNAELTVKYDDSEWNKLLPLNPYGKFFYTFKGQSSVVVTGHTATFDVELGAIPAYDLTPHGLPVVLSAPTWFTVGPSEFWGGSSNFGVFSTGLVGTTPLPGLPRIGKFAPKLSLHVAVQYYRILNDRLLLAQQIVGTAGSSTHPNVVVPSIGIAANF